MTNVTKGARIAAEWFADTRPVPLAGMQMKVQATKFSIVGTVRHVRGDDPTAPALVLFYVDPEGAWDGPTAIPDGGCSCGRRHVEVMSQHVTAVL